jgi:hypothetical protein
MATAEVLNLLETWLGRSLHGFATPGNPRRTIERDERAGRLSDSTSLETRLGHIAQTWVELCASFKVRIGGLLCQAHSFFGISCGRRPRADVFFQHPTNPGQVLGIVVGFEGKPRGWGEQIMNQGIFGSPRRQH